MALLADNHYHIRQLLQTEDAKRRINDLKISEQLATQLLATCEVEKKVRRDWKKLGEEFRKLYPSRNAMWSDEYKIRDVIILGFSKWERSAFNKSLPNLTKEETTKNYRLVQRKLRELVLKLIDVTYPNPRVNVPKTPKEKSTTTTPTNTNDMVITEDTNTNDSNTNTTVKKRFRYADEEEAEEMNEDNETYWSGTTTATSLSSKSSRATSEDNSENNSDAEDDDLVINLTKLKMSDTKQNTKSNARKLGTMNKENDMDEHEYISHVFDQANLDAGEIMVLQSDNQYLKDELDKTQVKISEIRNDAINSSKAIKNEIKVTGVALITDELLTQTLSVLERLRINFSESGELIEAPKATKAKFVVDFSSTSTNLSSSNVHQDIQMNE